MQDRLVLCDMKGRFLYEVMPSVFPEGELSETEVHLWRMYYKEKAERRNRKA